MATKQLTDFVGGKDVFRLEGVGQTEDDRLGEGGHQHVLGHHQVGGLLPENRDRTKT